MNPNPKTDPVITAMADIEDGAPTPANPYTADAEKAPKGNPIGRWLPISAGLLVLVGVACLYLPGFFKAHTLHTQKQAPLAALLGSAAPISGEAIKTIAGQETAAVPGDKAAHVPPPPMPVQVLADNPKVAQLETQLAQATAMLKTLQVSFAAEKQAHETQIKVLNDKLKALQKQAAKPVPVAVRPAAKPTQTKLPLAKQPIPPKLKGVVVTQAATAKNTLLSPPFKLAGIDHWGNETHVVVRYQGQLHTLMPGNSLLGWTVVGPNETGEGVYVVNTRGQRALLTMNGTPGQ